MVVFLPWNILLFPELRLTVVGDLVHCMQEADIPSCGYFFEGGWYAYIESQGAKSLFAIDYDNLHGSYCLSKVLLHVHQRESKFH